MSRSQPRHRVLEYAVLLVYTMSATSCGAWKAQVKPVREVVDPSAVNEKEAPKPPDKIRVMRDGKGPIVVHSPFVRNDSLFGYVAEKIVWEGAYPRSVQPSGMPSFSAPLDSISRIEVLKSKPAGTVAVVVLAIGVVGAFLAFTFSSANWLYGP